MIKTASHTCKTHWQDKRYGKGKRVFSEKLNGNLVCSVCGTQESA